MWHYYGPYGGALSFLGTSITLDCMSSSDAGIPPQGAAAASGHSSAFRRVVGLGLAAIVLVALAIPKIVASDESDGAGGGRSQEPLAVEGHVVTPGPVQNRIITTGTLRANEAVDLTSEASGKVTRILFEEGSRVEAGQLLLTINDAELQAERQRLEHRLRLLEDRRRRQEQLLEEGGVSQEAYDETVNEVNVLQAELALVEARIEKTRVRAPFSGTIGLRYVSEGSYVSPQTRIATLQSIDPIKIDLSVPEKYSSRIRPGVPIVFGVRGADASYEGEVYAIEPQVDPDTRSLRLRAWAANGDGRLRPGAFADVTVLFETIEDALAVPAFAVLPELGGQRVFVVEDGRAQPRSVEIGVRTDSTVQITRGLAPQDTVIVSGIQQLRPELPVRVKSLRD